MILDISRPDRPESVLAMLKCSNDADLELSVCLSADPNVLDHTCVVSASRRQGARVRSLHLSAGSYRVLGRGIRSPGTAASEITAINESTLLGPHPLMPHPANLFRSLTGLSPSLPPSAAVVKVSTILNII